jgi:hypothetical protein
VLRLLILAGLYAVAFVLLGVAASLAVSALSKGALPHVWLWGMAMVGGLVLFRALQLTRRFGDPSAWRRRRHSPSSLLIAVAGFGIIAIAGVIGPHSGPGHVAVVIGGGLLIVSELRKRPRG